MLAVRCPRPVTVQPVPVTTGCVAHGPHPGGFSSTAPLLAAQPGLLAPLGVAHGPFLGRR